MNIIKYLRAKKMIKIINKEIKVRYAKRLECEPDNAKVYVGFKNNKIENDTFRDYVNELTSNCTTRNRTCLYNRQSKRRRISTRC